jgi:hypothetical protein
LVQREVMDTAPKFEWIVREYFRPFHKRLRSLIQEGVASGEFRKVDAEQTVFTLLGMTVFYFAAAPVMSQVSGRNVLSPPALKERKHALLDFLDHGLMRAEMRQR